MDYLPLFLELRGRACLLVGGGDIARRKLELLLRAGAEVEIVAPHLGAETRELAQRHGLTVRLRPFRAEDAANRYLIVAATDRAEVNRQVFEAGSALNTFVNSVDDPGASSAIFPALIDRTPVLVAVSTGGGSPTLARSVRRWIEARLPARLGALAEFIAARRTRVKESLGTIPERQRFWEGIIDGTVAERLLGGDAAGAAADFERELEDAAAGKGAAPLIALIGAGPGDPELMTLKALRLLQGAEVVLYDNLVNRAILDFARRDAQLVYVGKRRSFPGIRQEGINDLLLEHARAGRSLVRLKGGDPFIFGRGGEEVEALLAEGFGCVVVPGITAALGAASYAGIPLTHREVSQSVRFVTGHRVNDAVNLDWPELVRPDQTLVIYMGRPGLPEILAKLMSHGMPPETPAALVVNATLPDQRVIQGTVADLAARVEAADLHGPSTVILGNVVGYRKADG